MKWCEFISEVYAVRQNAPGVASEPAFQPPASYEGVAAVEQVLNVKLPTDLKSLLLETNGILEMLRIDDGEWFENLWFFWTTSDIIEENLHIRRATMHPYDDNRRYCPRADELLFFAGSGWTDVQLAYPVNGEGLAESRVVAWYPILNELIELAPDLAQFIEGWLSGTILA
jgi:SMI1-KNR4 cell-wall